MRTWTPSVGAGGWSARCGMVVGGLALALVALAAPAALAEDASWTLQRSVVGGHARLDAPPPAVMDAGEVAWWDRRLGLDPEQRRTFALLVERAERSYRSDWLSAVERLERAWRAGRSGVIVLENELRAGVHASYTGAREGALTDLGLLLDAEQRDRMAEVRALSQRNRLLDRAPSTKGGSGWQESNRAMVDPARLPETLGLDDALAGRVREALAPGAAELEGRLARLGDAVERFDDALVAFMERYARARERSEEGGVRLGEVEGSEDVVEAAVRVHEATMRVRRAIDAQLRAVLPLLDEDDAMLVRELVSSSQERYAGWSSGESFLRCALGLSAVGRGVQGLAALEGESEQWYRRFVATARRCEPLTDEQRGRIEEIRGTFRRDLAALRARHGLLEDPGIYDDRRVTVRGGFGFVVIGREGHGDDDEDFRKRQRAFREAHDDLEFEMRQSVFELLDTDQRILLRSVAD